MNPAKPAKKTEKAPPKKMGRPALPPEDVANQVIHVRLTAEELARFDAYRAEQVVVPARAAVIKALALRALDAAKVARKGLAGAGAGQR